MNPELNKAMVITPEMRAQLSAEAKKRGLEPAANPARPVEKQKNAELNVALGALDNEIRRVAMDIQTTRSQYANMTKSDLNRRHGQGVELPTFSPQDIANNENQQFGYVMRSQILHESWSALKNGQAPPLDLRPTLEILARESANDPERQKMLRALADYVAKYKA